MGFFRRRGRRDVDSESGPAPAPVTGCSLLDLPGELRTRIYRLTLTTDPVKLERRHRYYCRYCPRKTTQRVQPLFTTQDSGPRRRGACRCWARDGLNLLLANRQIHAEAATIFWGENCFSFRDLGAFTDKVGGALRPEYRAVLSHISIFADFFPDRPIAEADSRFFEALFQCKALETLELPAYWGLFSYHVGTEPPEQRPLTCMWTQMRLELPNLKALSWQKVGPWYIEHNMVQHDKSPAPLINLQCTRLAETVNLTAPPQEEYDLPGFVLGQCDYETCALYFIQHLDFLVKEELHKSLGEACRNRLPACVNDRSDRHELRLGNGTPNLLQYIFPPLSPETIALNASLRARDRAVRKARQKAKKRKAPSSRSRFFSLVCRILGFKG